MTARPKARHRRHARIFIVFGLVGILATTVHVTIGLSIASAGILRPFWANIFAFSGAFIVSYVGHYHFSFRSSADHKLAIPRFMAVALMGLMLNQVVIFMMVDRWQYSYSKALIVIVFFVPAATFILGKFWVFDRE